VAVAVTGTGIRDSLVALTAEERADLGFQCGLQQQPDAAPGHVFDHLAQSREGSENS
jgi:hypothetical protein